MRPNLSRSRRWQRNRDSDCGGDRQFPVTSVRLAHEVVVMDQISMNYIPTEFHFSRGLNTSLRLVVFARSNPSRTKHFRDRWRDYPDTGPLMTLSRVNKPRGGKVGVTSYLFLGGAAVCEVVGTFTSATQILLDRANITMIGCTRSHLLSHLCDKNIPIAHAIWSGLSVLDCCI